ncbi:MAG: RCC1 domain-containing protein [Phycisphaerae bacterium]
MNDKLALDNLFIPRRAAFCHLSGEKCGLILFARPATGQQPGSIVIWGDQVAGVDLSGGFTQVACGTFHNLALKAGGAIVGWGTNYYGESTVPEPDRLDCATGPRC